MCRPPNANKSYIRINKRVNTQHILESVRSTYKGCYSIGIGYFITFHKNVIQLREYYKNNEPEIFEI